MLLPHVELQHNNAVHNNAVLLKNTRIISGEEEQLQSENDVGCNVHQTNFVQVLRLFWAPRSVHGPVVLTPPIALHSVSSPGPGKSTRWIHRLHAQDTIVYIPAAGVKISSIGTRGTARSALQCVCAAIPTAAYAPQLLLLVPGHHSFESNGGQAKPQT